MGNSKTDKNFNVSPVRLTGKPNGNVSTVNGYSMKTVNSKDDNKNISLPQDTIPFESQVAGHSNSDGKSAMGLLKQKDGCILKPIEKQPQGDQELRFYQNLQVATDIVSVELKRFVPEFFGTKSLRINDKDMRFLVLKNAIHGFAEPCIMDIKIGKQTWEPGAADEKKENEQKKYTECKRDLGFCIPGFQVYKISSRKLLKYGKDYGKRLNKTSVEDAFRQFLNSDSGLNRQLLLQILARLWRILRWFRTQHQYRFYSSSLLVVYDARRLKQFAAKGRPSTSSLSPSSTPSPSPSPCEVNGGGGVFTFPATLSRSHSLRRQNSFSGDSWLPSFEEVCRTHSLINNYERDLQSMKDNYSLLLDDLVSEERQPGGKEIWANVKMIDFAHALMVSGAEPDTNYLEGLENVVKIFERLLEEVTSPEF